MAEKIPKLQDEIDEMEKEALRIEMVVVNRDYGKLMPLTIGISANKL